MELADAAAARAFVGEYDPENIQFRGNQPLSQAMAVLGGGPYSYFRYQAHLALENVLEVYPQVADEFEASFGRRYDMLDCYRLDDADYVLVMIGSFSTKARDAIDSLRAAGRKAGLLRPRLFRPLPAERIRLLLRGRRAVAVIDQNISMGMGGVLHSEFTSTLYGVEDAPLMASYIGGLGGRDISQQEFFAIVGELEQACDTGEQPAPRLLYTDSELTELRKLQAIARAEQAEIRQTEAAK